ncbi:7,8-didemethyl-8-hydroxy-5-deazariboflavin synthase [Croceicoccus estronivorus]|uniref:5-amino-6-(D-ribitylamino)uracil--L-tyrosine 4-hydroxyphenyl transferase CofH n=1 Tax=Croceicoccus estronivorus TaxID=1172626 RepID=UPI0008351DCF|nr:5-amino-6-(D-ribitylamino)uracil--L-tyrosine 4-hydroxyphenyl transferase CofH [Croceicoccus estronivorus]OCC23763.1 7,8-didemethyl-8-hydroxy-5-deazariboflavin synthase [Croceicoccus estronivorus]
MITTGWKSEQDFAALLAMPLHRLMEQAAAARDTAHGALQSWSSKVFIPLTQLCRNYCHYCTFSQPPQRGENPYLSREQVIEIARAGAKAGCNEALFTLGDKPELRFPAARTALDALGHSSTLSYLAEMCAAVRDETGLLPHVNAGVMGREDMAALREVSASQGLMLEAVSDRLCQKGGPHYRSPDKMPAARLETIRIAGELSVPFSTGILIGIGETRAERLDALQAIADLHARYGHVQEVIVQNFRAKPRTAMADMPEPSRDELLWTIACARLILGPGMNIQAPPNLQDDDFGELIGAGINDWGGVSPVTPDHVNPERPWPNVKRLADATARHGRTLVQRLPIYPRFLHDAEHWLSPAMHASVRASADAQGMARSDRWSPGLALPDERRAASSAAGVHDPAVARIVDKACAGELLDQAEITALFQARGPDEELVANMADQLRRTVNGDTITYVVNRNINYTNICNYRCGFCAFSKGSTDEALRGRPYDLDHDEVGRRVREAWDRGATEVCLQGGIHPRYTGETYLALARTVKSAVPDIHLHAFSPLEIMHGAATLNLPLEDYLVRLKEAGLGTLPGTAAEILDDEVRALLCPDKLNTAEWLEVVRTAHSVGLKTTATIMFGHLDRPHHWARHLIAVRDLQRETGGFTEFVPLPFVHMEAPISLRGQTRLGPTLREVRLMHAVARLVLHPHITSIQTSWVKLGPQGAALCLQSGTNDIGGTLMNESISRAAGTTHGQEMPPEAMDQLIASLGRTPRQRTTLYGPVDEVLRHKGYACAPLAPLNQTRPRRKA